MDENVSWRYLTPDSRPQFGYNWLVLREDRFDFPVGIYTCQQEIVDADMNEAQVSRTCLLSTIGRGRGALINKSYKISTVHKMESGTESRFDKLRNGVYGVCADQGRRKELQTKTS